MHWGSERPAAPRLTGGRSGTILWGASATILSNVGLIPPRRCGNYCLAVRIVQKGKQKIYEGSSGSHYFLEMTETTRNYHTPRQRSRRPLINIRRTQCQQSGRWQLASKGGSMLR